MPASPTAPNRSRITIGNAHAVLKTANGHELTLDQTPNGSITIAHAAGSSITVHADGTITIGASARVTIAAAEVIVDAAALTVDAQTATFSGIVKADTVIANSVIAASYAPGAGNIW